MTVFAIPALEEEPWPTLGPQVCDYIEANLVFGPGDLLGLPARLDDEKRALVYRMYEVYPQGARDDNGKLIEGRRRFNRFSVSLPKGTAKTELAAWVGGCELSPEAPVRCDGFDTYGRPVGRPVVDPVIPFMAYTEEQSDDLAYTALRMILERSQIAQLFDIGYERILRAAGDGKAMAVAGAPDARDGARTTFQHKDETHRWTLDRLRRAHRTTLANLAKRPYAEPWEFESTTAYVPGQNSVAEQTAKYAAEVAEGNIRNPRLFYFHRQAGDGYDLTDKRQLEAAIIEALGPVNSRWRDIEAIASQWQDPEADKEYLERVFLNRRIATSALAFNATKWLAHAYPKSRIKAGEKITLGFDGSLYEDATALIATHVRSGFQWPAGIWEKPQDAASASPAHAAPDWEVPKDEVDAVVDEMFRTFDVLLMYGDPSKWDSEMATWAGRYGSKRVVAWPTTLYRKMATALKAYANAIVAGEVKNNGDPRFARHIGNAQKNVMNFVDDDGSPLWLIQKDRPHSPNKIDAAMGGCLSWTARNAAIATGVLEEDDRVGFTWVDV